MSKVTQIEKGWAAETALHVAVNKNVKVDNSCLIVNGWNKTASVV
jgi:hypothetical protein